MRIPSIPAWARDVRFLAALAMGAVGTAYFWAVRRPAVEPEPAAPDAIGRPRAWVRLDGSPILLRPGERYRGCVVLPWYVPSAAVTDDKVRAYAEKLGFGDVRVMKQAGCDVLVEAEWRQGYRDFERPSALRGAWALRYAEPIV